MVYKKIESTHKKKEIKSENWFPDNNQGTVFSVEK